MTLSAERNVAVHAVWKACALCRAVHRDLVSEETLAKRDRSPVTVADFGAQAVVCHSLLQAFPTDPIVAEENSDLLRNREHKALRERVAQRVRGQLHDLPENQMLEAIDSGRYHGGATGRFWVLDPVDGTKGYLRGDQYAVALALIEDGRVRLAVMGCPNLAADSAGGDKRRGVLFVAERSAGTVMCRTGERDETPVRVAEEDDPANAVFCESFEPSHSAQDVSARVMALLNVNADPLRMDSQCKYGVVAHGAAAVYLRLPTRADYVEKIWDHAAGSLIVTEAGGRVTDVQGDPLDFSQGRYLYCKDGIIATNGRLHNRVLDAVRLVTVTKT